MMPDQQRCSPKCVASETFTDLDSRKISVKDPILDNNGGTYKKSRNVDTQSSHSRPISSPANIFATHSDSSLSNIFATNSEGRPKVNLELKDDVTSSSSGSSDQRQLVVRRSARLRKLENLKAKAKDGVPAEGVLKECLEEGNERKLGRSIEMPKNSNLEITGKASKFDSGAVVKLEVSGRKRTNKMRVKPKVSMQLPDPLELRRLQVELRAATSHLASLHPEVVDRNQLKRREMLQSCGLRSSLIDAVISTMLSQNTTDANSKAAFKNLKKAFPSWGSILGTSAIAATTSQTITPNCNDDPVMTTLVSAIRVAGLAKTRAERIRSLLQTIYRERGELSLEYLRDMPDENIKKELGRFKGLGPKTVSCVMLFGLGRETEFPVDTHVLRISKQMRWIPSSVSTREDVYEYLNRVVPDDVKLDLHCLLVTHGKQCHRCAANGKPQFPPKNGTKLKCPLVPKEDLGNTEILYVKEEHTSCTAKSERKRKVEVESELFKFPKVEAQSGTQAFIKEELPPRELLQWKEISRSTVVVKKEFES